MFVSVLLADFSCGLCRCRPVAHVVCAVAGRSLVCSVPLPAGLSCGAHHTVIDAESERINWRCLAARPRAGSRAALKR